MYNKKTHFTDSLTRGESYQGEHDEDDGKRLAEHCLGRYVSIADRRQGDEHKVETIAERHMLRVLVIIERISVVFQLKWNKKQELYEAHHTSVWLAQLVKALAAPTHVRSRVQEVRVRSPSGQARLWFPSHEEQ